MSNAKTTSWFSRLKRVVSLPRRTLRTAVLVLGATALLLGGAAHAQSTTGKTRYPIVMVHGLLGFDTLFGVDYFYGIPSALNRDGARDFLAQVSAANSTEVRGEQLLAQVKNILAVTVIGVLQ